MFTGGDPVIVSEDSGTFALVMSVFNQYEKHVSALYDTSLQAVGQSSTHFIISSVFRQSLVAATLM